jgi:hypothetical protein
MIGTRSPWRIEREAELAMEDYRSGFDRQWSVCQAMSLQEAVDLALRRDPKFRTDGRSG